MVSTSCGDWGEAQSLSEFQTVRCLLFLVCFFFGLFFFWFVFLVGCFLFCFFSPIILIIFHFPMNEGLSTS